MLVRKREIGYNKSGGLMGEFRPYPVPEYTPEQVFGPERMSEGESISQERVEELASLIQEDAQGFFDYQVQDAQRGRRPWSEVFEQMGQIHEAEAEDFAESPLEEKMMAVFWGMGEVLGQTRERNGLSRGLEMLATSPDRRRIAEIKSRFDELNVRLAEWQNDIVRVTLALAGLKKGRDFLKFFWESFHKLSRQAFEESEDQSGKIRSGVLGVITTIKIMNALGFETALPYPEQDAIHKIDLFARRGEQTLAIQVKSHNAPVLRVRCFALRERERTDALEGREKREAESRNLLLTNTRKYAYNWGKPVVPLWVDLDCYGGTLLYQDELTGQPARDFTLGKLAQEVEASLHQGGPDVS